MPDLRQWFDIPPSEAVNINLSTDLTITAPLNQAGERCPWPWEPQQLVGVPLGQYHCQFCGAMVVAGVRHVDYRDDAQCTRCDGSGIDPEHSYEGCFIPGQEEPPVLEPCTACQFPAAAPSSAGGE